jgi:hypothetical protein
MASSIDAADADVTMAGAAGEALGVSVAAAGDVDADGYDDVIVGAHGHGTSLGHAYVYLGGSAMNATADVTLTGEAATDQFGVSVASAGDVNADGRDDVMVGAHIRSSSRGEAYLYFGGASMDSGVDLSWEGEAPTNHFGVTVAPSGDVNADGIADALTGAHTYGNSAGRAYVIYGAASTAGITLAAIPSPMPGQLMNFGINAD